MVENVITFGQFVIGLAVIGLLFVIIIAGVVELYDRITEKDESNEATKARLKSIKDGES